MTTSADKTRLEFLNIAGYDQNLATLAEMAKKGKLRQMTLGIVSQGAGFMLEGTAAACDFFSGAFRELDIPIQLRLDSVVTRSAASAAKAADRYRAANADTDLKTALERSSAHGVILNATDDCREFGVRTAVALDKGVLSEKPLAGDSQTSLRIVSMVEDSGYTNVAGGIQNHLYLPANQHGIRLFSGKTGLQYHGVFDQAWGNPSTAGYWRFLGDLGDGVAKDLFPHLLGGARGPFGLHVGSVSSFMVNQVPRRLNPNYKGDATKATDTDYVDTPVDDIASATLCFVNDQNVAVGTGTIHACRTRPLVEDGFSFDGCGMDYGMAWNMATCNELTVSEPNGTKQEGHLVIDSSRFDAGQRYNRPGHLHEWKVGHFENIYDWAIAMILKKHGETPAPMMVSMRFLHALQCQLEACVKSARKKGAPTAVEYI